MGLFGNLFSKQACGVCGKEVGALKRTKLKDGNYVCSDCRKDMSAFFRLQYQDLEAVKKHLEYMKKANELYEKEFANLDKSKINYCGHHGSYKIGFVDSIAMFAILTPETKRRNKKELFRYDEIESFGPYTETNALINRKENEKAIKEYGVQIIVHPGDYDPIKIPLQHNVDFPSGGERIFMHLEKITNKK